MTSGWSWLTPGAFALILLSAVPGFSHFCIMGRRITGTILFLSTAASLLLAGWLYNTQFADWMLWSALSISMWSMFAAADHMRPSPRRPADRFLATAGLCMLIVALYAGGYLGLRLAISPVANVISIQIGVPGSRLDAGDTVLVVRRDQYARGEVVVSQVNWQGREIPTIGRIIGMPGDILTLSDRLYVNGHTVPVTLPPPAGQDPNNPTLPEGRIQLKRNQYWVMPQFNMSPSPQSLLEAGQTKGTEMTGRVSAVINPAHHRRWVR